MFALIFLDISFLAEKIDINLVFLLQIQNKYLVEGMDVVIRYGLYNVGDSVASDIVLTEAGFGTDDFDIAGRLN